VEPTVGPAVGSAAIMLLEPQVKGGLASPRDTVWKRYFSPGPRTLGEDAYEPPCFSYGTTGQGALSADPRAARALAIATPLPSGGSGSYPSRPTGTSTVARVSSAGAGTADRLRVREPEGLRSTSRGALVLRRTSLPAENSWDEHTLPEHFPMMTEPEAEAKSSSAGRVQLSSWIPASATASERSGCSVSASSGSLPPEAQDTSRTCANSTVSFRSTLGQFGFPDDRVCVAVEPPKAAIAPQGSPPVPGPSQPQSCNFADQAWLGQDPPTGAWQFAAAPPEWSDHRSAGSSVTQWPVGGCTCKRDRSHKGDLAAAARSAVPRLLGQRPSSGAAASAVTLSDLRELRSFRNPPSVVCQVLEAVAVILGVPDTSWVKMKRLLDSSFLGRIRELNPANVSLAQAERLRALLQLPPFIEGLSLGERCPAIAALAMWCSAVGRELPEPDVPQPVPSGERAAADGSPARGLRAHSAAEPPPVAPTRPPSTTRPDLEGLEVQPDLWVLSEAELACVRDFSVSREGIGFVTFHGSTDCRALASGKERLSDLVSLKPGEVVVYPEQEKKPLAGSGLNKAATITLYGCVPKAKGSWDRAAREKFRSRVKQMTEAKGAEFLDYDCHQGVWQFRVPHF